MVYVLLHVPMAWAKFQADIATVSAVPASARSASAWDLVTWPLRADTQGALALALAVTGSYGTAGERDKNAEERRKVSSAALRLAWCSCRRLVVIAGAFLGAGAALGAQQCGEDGDRCRVFNAFRQSLP
jgi:hypothetical protein